LDSRRLPESFRRAWLVGGIAGGVGGALVGALSKSYLYALVAAVVLGVVGDIVGYVLLRDRQERAFRVYVEQPANSILATLSFVMAAAGLFVILVAREWLVGLSALFFFGFCGAHFVRRIRRPSDL